MREMGLPKGTDTEKVEAKKASQDATRGAIEVPFRVMETALASMEVIKAMAEIGNPNSVSDAGVGALCARTAVMGAFLNVKLNSADLEDRAYVGEILARGQKMEQKAMAMETQVLEIVNGRT